MITCPHCKHEFTLAPTLELDGQKTRRGMRLPDDFVPPDDWMRWARQHRPGVDATLQAQLFVNYWTSKAGADATKKDWFKTWQNWILQCRLDPKAVPMHRVTQPPAAPAKKAPAKEEQTEEQRERIRQFLAEQVKTVFKGVAK